MPTITQSVNGRAETHPGWPLQPRAKSRSSSSFLQEALVVWRVLGPQILLPVMAVGFDFYLSLVYGTGLTHTMSAPMCFGRRGGKRIQLTDRDDSRG